MTITHSAAVKSIATGSELTEETFNDFVQRLRHHVLGDGVAWHHTADALFTVQSRKIMFGIDRDYTDKLAVAIEDSMYFSPQEYWDNCDEYQRLSLDEMAKNEGDVTFLSIDESAQWDILCDLSDHTVSGWDERWECVNVHFTKEAAEAFIKRKKHDYRDGLRVYVEAQVYCWEFNAIIDGLMKGKIGFVQDCSTTIEPASAPSPQPATGAAERASAWLDAATRSFYPQEMEKHREDLRALLAENARLQTCVRVANDSLAEFNSHMAEVGEENARLKAQPAVLPPTEFWIKNESSASVSMSGDGKTLIIQDAAPVPTVAQYHLPDDLYDSKDWRNGSYAERVEWLHTMYENRKKDVERLESGLESLIPTVYDKIDTVAMQDARVAYESWLEIPNKSGRSMEDSFKAGAEWKARSAKCAPGAGATCVYCAANIDGEALVSEMSVQAVPDILPGEKRITFDVNGNSCINNLVYRDHAIAVKIALENELADWRAFGEKLKGIKP